MTTVVSDLRIKNPEILITDETGRKIVLRKPNRLAYVNYKIACGDKRDALQEEIMILPWVIQVGEEKINSPSTLVDIKHLIQILDNEGYIAAIKEVIKQLDVDDKKEEEAAEKKAL